MEIAIGPVAGDTLRKALREVVASWARRDLLRARPRAVLNAICGALLLGFGVLVNVEVIAHWR